MLNEPSIPFPSVFVGIYKVKMQSQPLDQTSPSPRAARTARSGSVDAANDSSLQTADQTDGHDQPPGKKRKRPYGVSCLVSHPCKDVLTLQTCREKKVACDGVRPTCGGCLHTGEDCVVP